MKPAKKKSSRKSSRAKDVVMRESNGGKLQTGNPGNKGGGRTPDEFKAKMRELVSSDEVFKYLQSCLRGKEGGKVAVAAAKWAAERGYGRVPLEVTGPNGEALLFKVYQGVNPEEV